MRRIAVCLLTLVVLSGCASTRVSNRETTMSAGEKLPRPNHILVYDFVATPADLPADSPFASDYAGAPAQTAEQIATGRQLGAQIAEGVADNIRGMGLPGARVARGTAPQLNDIVIRGYLISIQEGSAAKRVAIGFGSGASELQTVVEGYQMTTRGLRKLGSGTVDAGGGKMPGVAVPLAMAVATGNPIGLIVGGGMKVYGEASGGSKVEGRADATAKEISDQLKERFVQQGWIK